MTGDLQIPETRVLAIASHVVHGYVGNTMAAFVMQSFGCEVAALNTVQYSNHVAYGRFRGTKTSATEIQSIYEGLKENHLTDFDILLSGFAPSGEAVQAVGIIGRDLKSKASKKPGSFFWVVDPVMGDQGDLYVDESVVPVYKTLLRDADLLIPNQFELEILSETKISSPSDLVKAMSKLHKDHGIPHVIVTSVQTKESSSTISIIGSSKRTDGTPRPFKIDIPSLNCFFSGTGDLFAALTIVNLRKAAVNARLDTTSSWLSPDDVQAIHLPLAEATEKVLASMQAVLQKTKAAVDKTIDDMSGCSMDAAQEDASITQLRKTKAAEVNVVRHMKDIKKAEVHWKAELFEG